jgi:hypothetical protein
VAVPRHAGMNRCEIESRAERAALERVSSVISRRSALGALALPLAVTVPMALLGCSKELKCDDTSALPPDAKKARVEVAGYVERSTDVMKTCERCTHFAVGGGDQCGTCKIVEGPIHPKGTCKLFVAKT